MNHDGSSLQFMPVVVFFNDMGDGRGVQVEGMVELDHHGVQVMGRMGVMDRMGTRGTRGTMGSTSNCREESSS
jgi:hypothetical protein